VVACVGAGTVVAALAAAAAGLLTGGRRGAVRGAARAVAGGLQRLGPTASKVGQLVGARRDLIGPDWADALGVLHDRARPMPPRQRAAAVRQALADNPRLAEVELTDRLLGSGTVACVYLGRYRGQEVAVKLRRPGVGRVMAADLRLLRAAAGAAARLSGPGGAPLADLVDYMSEAVFRQTDFVAEARNHLVLAENLRRTPGVRVPRLRTELCGRSVLVTDFIPDLESGVRGDLSATALAVAARRALRAVRRMVFEDGFVHCDLHPGNLYVYGNGTVAMLDAGYAVQVSEPTRRHLDRFFRAMALRDGRTCGEIMFDTSLDPHGDAGRRAEFVAEMAEHVARHSAPGHRFTIVEFGNGIFEIQSRHGVYSRSEFVFPLSALMVAEGTLRQLLPSVEVRDGWF